MPRRFQIFLKIAFWASCFLFPVMKAGATCVDFYKSTGSYLTFKSGGLERVAYVRWPKNIDLFKKNNLPLVLDIHGSGGNGRHEMNMTGWGNASDQYNIIVVAPQGYIKSLDGYAWVVPVNKSGGVGTVSPKAEVDDLLYLKDLISIFSSSGCVDNNRIYLSGFSGGARLASQYACQAPEKIAGLIAVAGLRAGGSKRISENSFEPDPNECSPQHPLSILSYANLDDDVNPYGGGGMSYWGYGVEKALARWIQILGCNPSPYSENKYSKQIDRIFSGCAGDAQVRTIVASNGGHVWPSMITSDGVAKNTPFIDVVIKFFSLQ